MTDNENELEKQKTKEWLDTVSLDDEIEQKYGRLSDRFHNLVHQIIAERKYQEMRMRHNG